MDLDWSCSSTTTTTTTTGNPYCLLFQALSLIPISHYLLFSSFVFLSFLYRFLELHFLQDLFSLFSGSSVTLTYHHGSQFYDAVVSKCRILHGTYLATPWLSSPHLQTVFLNFLYISINLHYFIIINYIILNHFFFVWWNNRWKPLH